MKQRKGPDAVTLVLVLAGLWLAFGGAAWQGCDLVGPVGPLTLIIAEETSNTPLPLASLEVQLRDGPAAKTLADKGRKLLILDNEDEAIAKYRPFDDAKPELLIEAGGKLRSRQPVPMTVDAFLKAAN